MLLFHLRMKVHPHWLRRLHELIEVWFALCCAVRYVTVLGAVYLRLVGKPVDVYSLLEPLYSDYRKIRKRNVIGTAAAVSTVVVVVAVVVGPVFNRSLTVSTVRWLAGWEITHVDEIIDALLTEEYYIDLSLPRLMDRDQLEKSGELLPRKSVLEDELDGSDDAEEDDGDDGDDSDDSDGEGKQ